MKFFTLGGEGVGSGPTDKILLFSMSVLKMGSQYSAFTFILLSRPTKSLKRKKMSCLVTWIRTYVRLLKLIKGYTSI